MCSHARWYSDPAIPSSYELFEPHASFVELHPSRPLVVSACEANASWSAVCRDAFLDGTNCMAAWLCINAGREQSRIDVNSWWCPSTCCHSILEVWAEVSYSPVTWTTVHESMTTKPLLTKLFGVWVCAGIVLHIR